MRISKRDTEKLDCVESDDLLVVIKGSGSLVRDDFSETELRPLLRQSIVSVAAAVEVYIAEKASSYIGGALDGDVPGARGVTVTLGEVFDIEQSLTRRRFGWRRILKEKIERDASASPRKIDSVFNLVGKSVPWAQVDKARGLAAGKSRDQMKDLASRRNRIAHTGDRRGAGRAAISIVEAQNYLDNAKASVEALEATL